LPLRNKWLAAGTNISEVNSKSAIKPHMRARQPSLVSKLGMTEIRRKML